MTTALSRLTCSGPWRNGMPTTRRQMILEVSWQLLHPALKCSSCSPLPSILGQEAKEGPASMLTRGL